jgi:hypothetical protein
MWLGWTHVFMPTTPTKTTKMRPGRKTMKANKKTKT